MDRSAPIISATVLADENAVEGRRADILDGRVISFTYEDTEDKADKATLTPDNREPGPFEQGGGVRGRGRAVGAGAPHADAEPRPEVAGQALDVLIRRLLEGVHVIDAGHEPKLASGRRRRVHSLPVLGRDSGVCGAVDHQDRV